MEYNDLSIVIVTYQSESKIFDCLKSIPKNIRVFVIENSNNQEFKKKIQNDYKNASCILTGANKGYAVGNNIGLSQVTTNFALVLNPDAILDKNVIQNFSNFVNNNPDFWLLGPGNSQKENYNFPSSNILEVENLKGFGIFFNMKKFNKIFFDENFFLYFEEIDLCKNVRKKGGTIYLDRNIKIIHEGASSVSNNKFQELEKNRNWHWMWSTFYFHKKHKGILISLILIFPKLLSSIIRSIFYQITQNKEKRDIYLSRLSGLFNSIIGKKSWYRPSLD